MEANPMALPLTSEFAVDMIKSVIFGLQFHGEHEANMANLLSLAVQVYEFLRPLFRSVRSVSLDFLCRAVSVVLVEVTPEIWQNFG